ncbi:YqiA/YcfP family alpha/beta fold hydrolase [Prevotella sp. KH2C16]|uniref:YqiA/YcfP family alpha/beta fold hydrolase n=1 Tax=Prevotella sp. KH2C16 TaxID=1855325 RepID=UPI0008F12D8B|nr:YqiA/YcfP family alpha/beta fold hydrolase [Prevotella sp. KH2C16]SFG35376.1 hypothetical protein SAMN05216383_11116 [Prevotella sp. KH2C16]
MENQYIKQFPDLMRGKRIMYVHGFGSSAQSGTVRRIAETFPSAEVIAYDLPLHPEEALALLREKTDAEKPDLIIGTSMGGMYAEMLRGYDRILVNPAFEMGETMTSHGMAGKQTFQNPRQDGVQEFIVTKAMIKEYKEITTQCFQGITPEEQGRVFGLFGDKDPVVHTFDLFRSHYAQAARFHGEHRMTDESFLNGVVPVIRWIDDRQEHRERPIVYIDFATLRDDYGKDRSSMRKAYRMLIETYEVYILVPAPTNEPERLAEANSWIEEYLSTPAWNHVVYTNQPRLLYGDYLISAAPDDAFMGTGIPFGSDEFKTWEEIITYFERLGGQ